MNNDEVVLSPCVDICALDEKDICIGCMRSADEILDWGIMSNEQKRLVLKNIALRLEVDQK
ncbi:MAG TPA: DUF1289 domain-containing protein [Pseudomonadales bacterium]